MSNHSPEETSTNSSFNKKLGIFVVIFILAIVTYKLARSPTETTTTITSTAPAPEKSAENADDQNTKTNESTSTNYVADSTDDTGVNNVQAIKEIKQFLEDWRSAWQKSAGSDGNLQTYFDLYSDDFTSGELNKEQWQNSKQIRNQGKSWIEIWISDVIITENSAVGYSVTFKQEYSSSNYSDKGSKELIVQESASGWQILSEIGR